MECSKRKMLMQINLEIGNPKDNKLSLNPMMQKQLSKTYMKGVLNIFASNRKDLIESFNCFWQISYMSLTTAFGLFPLVQGEIYLDRLERMKSEEEGSSG